MDISKMANISIQFMIIYLNFLGFKLLCACVCAHARVQACSYCEDRHTCVMHMYGS